MKHFSLHFPKIVHLLITNHLERNRAKQLELLVCGRQSLNNPGSELTN